MKRKALLILSFVLALQLVVVPLAHAAFGFVPGSVGAASEEEGGLLDLRAGSHPFQYTIHFELNTDATGATEGGQMRDLIIEAPSGLAGNPNAIPACPRFIFEGGNQGCTPSTQVGVLTAVIRNTGRIVTPIYNLVPPPGVAVEFGVSAKAAQLIAQQLATVRTENSSGEPEYGVNVGTSNVPVEISSVSASIWGTPADSGHTPERGPDSSGGGFTSEAPRVPFLTLPASCNAPPSVTIKVDSVQNPGVFVSETAPMLDAGGNPVSMVGCGAVPFNPGVAAAPSTTQADSSAGLGFELAFPNEGLLTESAVAETEPEKTEVVLPQGVGVNPSAANGIAGCTLAQYHSATVDSPGCPAASKVGTLVAKTPLLGEAIEGGVYLASPHDNPFGSLLGLYIVATAKERGILIKQAGLVQADPSTGQLTTTFDGLPPLPYSSFEFDLREGPRAPLVTPQACGEYQTVAKLYPFSAAGSATVRIAPFQVTSGAGGGACASGEGSMPAKPSFEAGTVAPVAGSYSPFVFNVSRNDGEQRFSSVQATLPPGLLGKLKGVPYCPESGIATASSRTQEGDGALEQASPSCPASSQVGVVDVAAGAGSQPYRVQGKVYLAGSYKGAPLSLEIITPAIAGPFDLGTVAVRAALTVDPFSAQVSAQSDPLPSILHGIPLDVRSISLQMNRGEFTLNPTNCGAKTVAGSVSTLAGGTASLADPFAVGGCKGLEFKPQVKLSLKGSTKRTGRPSLKAVVTYPKGSTYANIARAQVGLPGSEFLQQGAIHKTCSQGQLRSATCPDASVYGKATAYTPLLDKPLSGPVYLVGGFGYKLPALVADLNGQIRVLLKGKVDTDRQKGIRTTFEAVPDAPVEKFVLEMKGGKKFGLLENSVNICKGTHKAEVKFNGQNGKVDTFETSVNANCKGRKRKGGGKRQH